MYICMCTNVNTACPYTSHIANVIHTLIANPPLVGQKQYLVQAITDKHDSKVASPTQKEIAHFSVSNLLCPQGNSSVKHLGSAYMDLTLLPPTSNQPYIHQLSAVSRTEKPFDTI